MKTHVDLLSDRAADWLVTVGSTKPTAGTVSGDLASRGWVICEQLRRRGAGNANSTDQRLIESIENRIGGSSPSHATATAATASVESATAGWNGLMNTLDLEEANFQHVRRETRDVFFSVLDALLLAEEAGGDEADQAAQALFNTVVGDLYVFEPLADVAAELQRPGADEYRLSDLLCTGVAGMFDGQVRERTPAMADDAVRIDEGVEEFLPLSVWLQRGQDAARPLTLATLAKRLAEIPAWYVKWSTQQLRLSLAAATRELRVQVIGEGATASTGMDGWQIRTGTGTKDKPATIKAGAASLTLPEKLDPSKLVLQVRDAAGGEWTDVFARLGA